MLDMYARGEPLLVIQATLLALSMVTLTLTSQQSALKATCVLLEAITRFLDQMEHTRTQKVNRYVNLVLQENTVTKLRLQLQKLQPEIELQVIFVLEEQKFISQ